MKIYFATRLRSFFKHLSSNPNFEHQFIVPATYDLLSKRRKLLAAVAKTPLFDLLGYIQMPKAFNKDGDLYGSFNRFLYCDKPYFIYLENPTALYHYRLQRGSSLLGRKRTHQAINSDKLRALVFMSQACAQTFEIVCSPIPDSCKRMVIYPYVPLNMSVSKNSIKLKSQSKELRLLYIAQGIRFLSKGGLEILQAFKALRNSGMDITLHMITSISDLDASLVAEIRNTEGVQLSDFTFSYSELEDVYASSHILLQPSSDDSYGLTILEAMKSGLPVIGSTLYAIPEMVADGYNGFLTEPHYWFFDKNNIPNPAVWNHRKRTIYSGRLSKRIVDFLLDRISALYHDRDLLYTLSVNSWNKAKEGPFSEEYITAQWNELINMIGKNGNERF